MICAWPEYLKLLPDWMREDVDRLGRDKLQELRLRIGQTPELVMNNGAVWLHRVVRPEDLSFIVNAASQYSPWSAATAGKGYITAPGGHRIGLCGDVTVENGEMKGSRVCSSLCLRVARDFPGIAVKAASIKGSVLILGRPGSGKTTLLRDLVRQRSEAGDGAVAVVDERGELFPVIRGNSCFSPGRRTDILSGCSKQTGIRTLLRTMGPICIAVDEITEKKDCDAMLEAGWCGVTLVATAHASDRRDLLNRPVYQSIASSRLFETVLVMQPDKTWKAERM